MQPPLLVVSRAEKGKRGRQRGAREVEMAVVRVKRELLASCMTCPICNHLLNNATTISECLHTFCRKCILDKLTDEEEECCPVCNRKLGCVPEEKLRPDHNLQEIRVKIFPFKRKKVTAPEIAHSVTLPIRRKERSLSSLSVNTPRVISQSVSTGRRTKATTRRASTLRGLGPIIEEPKKENICHLEPSNHTPNKNTDTSELWKPLNCLLEAANRTKAIKSSPQSSVSIIREEKANDANNEVLTHKKSKNKDENNSSTLISQTKVRARRLQGKKKRDLETSTQALVDSNGATRERRTSSIWLCLVPSNTQKGDGALPQKSACYLRIKDSSLPVSIVQKYLVKKLNLASEAEVEIAFRGQTVGPTLALQNLADIWLLSTPPPERVQATVGSSAKDFVMVLNYSHKAPAS